MESDTLSIGEATGGAPFEEPQRDLPPPQQAADRLSRDRRHQSGSASMDDGYPPIQKVDEIRVNECMDGKDQEGQELLVGYIQRDLERRRHVFNRRRRAFREEKDAMIVQLHAELARSEANRKTEWKASEKARKQQERRAAEAAV